MAVHEFTLPVKLYPWRKLSMTGGPFRLFEQRRAEGLVTYGVKLAPEVPQVYDLMLPIEDFSVPDDERSACACALITFRRILNGEKVYVGCVGGTGRTGLFFAMIAKALGAQDPVRFVRKNYKLMAVETAGQQAWIEDLDVTDLGLRMKTLLWQKRLLPFVKV